MFRDHKIPINLTKEKSFLDLKFLNKLNKIIYRNNHFYIGYLHFI